MGIFRGTGGTGDSTTDTTVTTVTQKAAEAASSATSAANSATSAANSASSASTSATNAATSATNAATSATASATSATASETAKTAAQAAQTAAETAKTNAETAEANAVTAKNQAVSAKDNAVTAQTAAETAETNAETAYANTLAIYGSTTDVQNAVNSASASATTATTKAAEAASSATDASNYSSSAGTSATQAASSASQAATSANTAGSHATDAQTAQTAAETAQAAAEAAEYNINGLYLGSLANDPTLDGNGVAVTTGDLYFNTTEQEVRVYTDGDVWEPVVDLAGDITVNSLTSNNNVVVKGNLEVQGTTITVNSATAQTIDLGDNDKIRLGDSDDLQIYHTGSNSVITDVGQGSLYIGGDNNVIIASGNLNTTKARFTLTDVELYYEGAQKFATTSSGVDVTGNITVSGTVDGRDIATDGTKLDGIETGATADQTKADIDALAINADQVDGLEASQFLRSDANDTATGNITVNGLLKTNTADSSTDGLNIENTGGAIVNQYFTGSASTDEFVITRSGTGGAEFRINSSGAVRLGHAGNGVKFETTSSGVDITGDLVADGLTVDTDTLYVDATNNRVGIGTTSPAYVLDVRGSGAVAKFGSGGVLADGYINFNSRGFIGYNGSTGATTIQSGADKSIDIRRSGEFGAGTRAMLIGGSSGNVLFYEDTGTTAKLTWDASDESLNFSDSVRLKLGSSADFQGFHNGSNSYWENYTGDLYIDNRADDKDVNIRTDNGSGGYTFYFKADGSTGESILYHYGSQKLATKSTGIDVTGTVTADGLKIDSGVFDINLQGSLDALPADNDESHIFTTSGSGSGFFSKFGALGLSSRNKDTSSSDIGFFTDKLLRVEIADTGDISFYNDAGTSQDLYWDASASRLGLGTTSPGGVIHATSSGVSTFVFQGADVGEGTLFQIRNGTNNSATGNGHRLEFVHGNNNSRNVFFRTSSSGTFGRSPVLYIGSQNDTGGAELDHIQVQAGGDVIFYNDASTSQDFYWDASASRLGLGTTTPAVSLDVRGDGTFYSGANTTFTVGDGVSAGESSTFNLKASYNGNRYFNFNRGTTVESRILCDSNEDLNIDFARSISADFRIRRGSSSVKVSEFYDTGDIAFFDSTGASKDFYWDASTSRLGIGTTSPFATLDVEGTVRAATGSEYTDLKYYGVEFNRVTSYVRPDTDGTKVLLIGADNVNKNWQRIEHGASDSHRFNIGASEAMRIDSSGNLLVGTTSTLAGPGVELRSDGQIVAIRSNNRVAWLNRAGSDGSIVDFVKDGTTVGSIGAKSGDLYIGTGDVGLKFSDQYDTIHSVRGDTGADLNGAVDLGRSNVRWRNLYLSGGVYLGGTGADNLLDDYEEGTWTPVLGGLTSTSGQTYNIQAGWYRKVGSLVTASFFCDLTTAGTISGAAVINGLPLTSQATSANYRGHISSVGYSGLGISPNSIAATVLNNTTQVRLGFTTSITSGQDFNTSGVFVDGSQFQGTITYITA